MKENPKKDIDLDVIRHSTAHLLAHAVKRLYPRALPTIGPAVENGFYYDFDNLDIKLDDLPKIENEMRKIAKENIQIKKILFKTKTEAKKVFKDNKYKIELIDSFDEGSSAYQQGDFIDLCKGPHVASTGDLKAFKLTKLAGAYWHGDQKNKMLTRIYGVAFASEKELNDYLVMLEEAEKRDHRKLGKELDLFSFHEEAPGMPFFHPKGIILWDELMKYWHEVHKKAGYSIVKTPLVLNKELWVNSGHWEHYKESMYFTKIDNADYAIKPMNCPGEILIYKTNLHSYKEFPLKLAEIGLVHRHELSGVLSGLFRVRAFHQDDAHVFCMEEQIEKEVISLIDLFDKVYSAFGLKFFIELSTKPENAMGSAVLWNKAEAALENAMKKKKLKYKLNPGDGAFYGPKLDFHIKDAIGRSWQCGTIQLDFQMPEKFNLNYEGSDGLRHRPVMLHRVVYGSIERFIGILIEHYAAKFPLWLAPEQIRILTISDKNKKYAEKVKERLIEGDVRTDIDCSSETINKKVREAQLMRVPLIVTVGDKEQQANTLAIRTLDGKIKFNVKVEDFIKLVKVNISERKPVVNFL